MSFITARQVPANKDCLNDHYVFGDIGTITGPLKLKSLRRTDEDHKWKVTYQTAFGKTSKLFDTKAEAFAFAQAMKR